MRASSRSRSPQRSRSPSPHRGDSQPATEVTFGKTQPGGAGEWVNAYDVSNINVASLNIGINQEMLQSHSKWPKHGKKLGQLVDRFFNADNNDVVFLSEFGDYRQGLEYSGVNLQALFEHAVGAGVQRCAQKLAALLSLPGLQTASLLSVPRSACLWGTCTSSRGRIPLARCRRRRGS